MNNPHVLVTPLPTETFRAVLNFKEQGHALCAHMGAVSTRGGWVGVYMGLWLENADQRDEREWWWAVRRGFLDQGPTA